MYKDLNGQLVQIKGKMSKKKKWETQLTDYRVELSGIEDTITELEGQLTEEMKDVKKLEGIGLTSLFQTFFGEKEEKLRKEKQEVVGVQLQLKEAGKTKKEINESIMELENKLQDVVTIESEYQNILAVKEEMIHASNSASARELYDLSEKEGDIQAYITELNEAINAGETVKYALANAVTSLESASGWGTFDMFGGGMISGAIKHSHIDEATAYIHQAQTKMRSFQKELLDVNETAQLHVDISGLLKFADFFFDGILSDWMVQGRIQDSLEQARSQQSNIGRITSNLNVETGKKEADLAALEIERNALIERF
ncbi:hypothetical protein CIL05_14755 [Virgibacillus profundi]|uniref:Uncharacterized protein n=1 Tax=Virgibacillus profundi TaxID=2024555 RepID=A0A2A2ICS9_9BACI|nr:hypothetical protein [Virgibacillus profundi]PAV28883.1 hypothetical protein CIL05_14755 [Virgibacillus profundi]PXY53051.1 hypothetical protein CIT14_14880 [Virgibacillus profundi]